MIIAKIYSVGTGVILLAYLLLADKGVITKYKKYIKANVVYTISVITGYLVFINIIPDIISLNITLNFYDKLLILLMSMSVAMLIDSLLIRFYQICKEKITLIMKERKLSTDIKNYIYYRDILDGYLPGTIQYCYKKNINMEDVIVATLLDLKRKSKIKIENGEVITNKLVHDMDITDYEKTILLCLCNGGRISKKELKNKIKEETKKAGLIIGRGPDKGGMAHVLELFSGWQLIFNLVNFPLFTLSSFGGLVYLSYFLIFLCIPLCKSLETKVGFTRRTKKGIEISAKMMGLKKYINEFSKIQDNNLDNIELFDDYVIYAIILNLPGKLDKEVKALYNKLKCK